MNMSHFFYSMCMVLEAQVKVALSTFFFFFDIDSIADSYIFTGI